MYICLCNPFSDRDVQDYLAKNKDVPAKVGHVYTACTSGEKPQCCSCLQTLKDVLAEHKPVESAG